jgi:hypothetical protein
VKLVGDATGIAALKELSQHNRDYLKFLIAEAGTNTNHAAGFTGPDGTKWILIAKPGSGELEVKRAG